MEKATFEATRAQCEALNMPATVVTRIIKEALPANAAVSKETRSAIGRAAAVFILHLTNFANEHATAKKRKMITPEDVYIAVKALECDNIEKPLKEAVEIFKTQKAQKAEDAKKRKAERALEKELNNSGEQAKEDVQMESDEHHQSQNGMDESYDIPETAPLNEQDIPETMPFEVRVRDIEDM